MQTQLGLKLASSMNKRCVAEVLGHPEGAHQSSWGSRIEVDITRISRQGVRAGKSMFEAEGTSAKALGQKEMECFREGEQARAHICATCTQGLWLKSRLPPPLVHIEIYPHAYCSPSLQSYPHLQLSSKITPVFFNILVWNCWRQILSCLLFQKPLCFTFFFSSNTFFIQEF